MEIKYAHKLMFVSAPAPAPAPVHSVGKVTILVGLRLMHELILNSFVLGLSNIVVIEERGGRRESESEREDFNP